MTEPLTPISSNSATALLRILDVLGAPPATHNANINGWERWGELFDRPYADPSQRLYLSRRVYGLVLPLTSRCHIQLGTYGTDSQVQALRRVELVFYNSLGSVDQNTRNELTVLTDGTGALTISGQQIGKHWKAISSGLLHQLVSNVEDARESLKSLLDSNAVDALLIQPLSEALDNVLSGVQLSLKIEALVGVGPGLSSLTSTSVEFYGLVEVPSGPDAVDKAWGDLGRVLSVFAAVGALLSVAGFGGAGLLLVPVIADGLASLAGLTGIDKALYGRYASLVAAPGVPELGAGGQTETD